MWWTYRVVITTYWRSQMSDMCDGTDINNTLPIRVKGPLESCRIVSIACGTNHSMAVSDTGAVYSWGYNGCGQLGLGNHTSQLSPVLITHLDNICICRVVCVCGIHHTMVLSKDGIIYTFGQCDRGQLGTGNTQNLSMPVPIDNSFGRFSDLASNRATHMSAAVTMDGRCYVWGECQPPHGNVLSPMKTSYESLHDVFAVYSTPTVTNEMVVLSDVSDNPVMARLAQAFDDPNTSNFRIIVEGKPIHVHNDILRIQCLHFRAMFDNWPEGVKEELEVLTEYSYVVYEAFLRYLYTGEVCVAPEAGIELLDLAESYCETDLKSKCVRLIRTGISVENVLTIYSAVLKYEIPELEDLCFIYALAHLTQVTQTKAFKDMDPRIFKAFIIKASKKGAFK
ncbi:unnamed protein product [Oppiella nova]|uniref:BTB domain-containing protein n=1 Tax=Oppiella nova TaxID=334625 RepID=A0A7R9QX00_9ACAR|nr:unnamed protein product [Oppiella nova]CAG2177086.1 unnamed protein product [Oppiella nova]